MLECNQIPNFVNSREDQYENIVNLPAGESVVDNTNAKIKLINEENAKNGKPLFIHKWSNQ